MSSQTVAEARAASHHAALWHDAFFKDDNETVTSTDSAIHAGGTATVLTTLFGTTLVDAVKHPVEYAIGGGIGMAFGIGWGFLSQGISPATINWVEKKADFFTHTRLFKPIIKAGLLTGSSVVAAGNIALQILGPDYTAYVEAAVIGIALGKEGVDFGMHLAKPQPPTAGTESAPLVTSNAPPVV